MLSKAQLLQLIEECQQLSLIFSPSLTQKEIYWMKLEATVGFDFFKSLAEQFNFETELEKVEELIRKYLTERGALLGEKSSIAYLNHPFLPINQLCLKVAEAIAKPGESVWTILISSIEELCRPLFSSFKEDTEDEGHFPLEFYALDQTQTRLIPVAEIFSSAEVNTNAIFPDFQQDLTKLRYTLGGRDFLTLEQIGGEPTHHYMRALKQSHNRQFDDQSIGFAIRKLAQDLKRGAVGDAGTEFVADNEVLAVPIQSFYALWRSLPINIRKQVAPLKLKHYGYADASLECYFLTLFARCLGCELTDEESRLQQKADIFPCAQQISDSLDEYLTQHPQLYVIKINGQETEIRVLPDLKILREEALQALKTRGQRIGQDDRDLWSRVVSLMMFVDYPLPTVAQIIAPEIHQMYDLISLILISRQLFMAVLNCLHTRLGQLNFNMRGIHEVLGYFPPENQQIILQSRSAELASLIREKPQQYALIYEVLDPTLQSNFEQSYLKCMYDGIKYGDECVALMSTLSQSQLASILTYLQPRLHELFKDFDFALLFTYRVQGHQQLLIDALLKPLTQWLTPTTYLRWDLKWDKPSKIYFLNRYLEKSNAITSFGGLLKFLQQWRGHFLMHEVVLEHFKIFLKIWIGDSDHLSILLDHLEHPSEVLATFAHLINHKELLCRWLKLLPASSRLQTISAVNFSVFISSFAEFQEVTFKFEKEEQSLVLKQLEDLSFVSDSDELKQLRMKKTSSLIYMLEEYAQQSRNCTRLEVVDNLLKKLRNPQTSLAELIEQFQRERKKIASEYNIGFSFLFSFSTVNSRLHEILKQGEHGLQELLALVKVFDSAYAMEQSKKPELPENIRLFIERLKIHRLEHEFTTTRVDDLIEQLSSAPNRSSEELIELFEKAKDGIVSRTKTIGLISSFVESSAKNNSLYLLLMQFIKEIKELPSNQNTYALN